MSDIEYVDKDIRCVSCGQTFTHSATAQRFYAAQWFKDPRHCRSCREQRKAQREAELQQVAS
ncbi:MAG: hypothetical protein ABS36_14930 [Acidobacteria bacterium SCN 69-37]|nr:MAG: hypothetical protein ABS36_14930 [Acidobacteria bacterium SCN 69-37]